MSGICGVVHFDGRPVTTADLSSMTQPAAYRGAAGVHYQIDDNVGFAHLASHASPASQEQKQPLNSMDGDLMITLDGRIDNRTDLISTLFNKGILHKRDVSDVVLMLAAYRCWGIDTPRHLIGDFAFAIWDKRNRWLFAARDPLAMRSLYYRVERRCLLLATEIKQILAAPDVPCEINEPLLGSWLASSGGQMDETFYRGISQLTPAHALLVKATGHWVWRYRDITEEKPIRYRNDDEYVAHFREIFKEATRCRLHGDQPAGILLSGGVDSSSVAATAGWLHQHEPDSGCTSLRAYSFAFQKFTESDERHISDPLAAYFHLPVTAIVAEDHWPLKDYPKLGPDNDDPIMGLFQPLMQAALERAGADGVKNMFSGGYGDHMVSNISANPDLFLSGSLGALWKNLRLMNRQSEEGITTTFLSQVAWPLLAYLWPRNKYPYWRSFLSERAKVLPGFNRGRGKSPFPPWMNAQFARHVNLEGRLVPKNDQTHVQGLARRKRHEWLNDPFELRQSVSMERMFAQAGLISTEVWSDRRIMQFVLSVPPQVLSKPGDYKPLAKQAMRGIMPEGVRRQSGKIVPAPLAHWALREREPDTIRNLLRDSRLAHYGYADEQVLRHHFEEYVRGSQPLPDAFWPALTAEMWLREMEAGQTVVFATLLANPELRSAIEQREERVLACVSGQDLPDKGAEMLGQDYDRWHQNWTKYTADPDFFYWYGLTEHVCFSWGEPDISIWNPANRRVEDGWPIVPPAYCLEHRPIDAPPLLPVKRQARGKGPLQPSVHVIFAEFDGRLCIAHVQNEHCFQLDGVGQAMWQAIFKYGNKAQVLEALGAEYAVEPARLEADLDRFVDDLLARDLLEWTV